MGMLDRLRLWASRWRGAPPPAAPPPPSAAPASAPFDETLLERARLQWHLGDWDALAQLDHDTLADHPDRAKLVLLLAAALQQLGRNEQAARHVELARNWGCSKKLIAQILIAGVHNSLARASLLAGQEDAAQAHFRLAVCAGTPGLDSPLVIQARARHESARLAAALADPRVAGAPDPARDALTQAL